MIEVSGFCKWGLQCWDADCRHKHPQAEEPPVTLPDLKEFRFDELKPGLVEASAASGPINCKWGSQCWDEGCKKKHPQAEELRVPPDSLEALKPGVVKVGGTSGLVKCSWGLQCWDADCKKTHAQPEDLPKLLPKEPVGVPPKFLKDLKATMVEASGRSGVMCRWGRQCTDIDCKNIHPEGRGIEENPESAVCKFKRNCMRKDCRFVHMSGRIIDEDPSKSLCYFGAQCEKPNCVFAHPGDRNQIPNQACTHCGQPGHLQIECPQRAGNRVRADAFPEAWRNDGAEALAQRLASYFEFFGDLMEMPEVSQDCSSAVAFFVLPSAAKEAVQTLTGDKVPFSLTGEKFSHEDVSDSGRSSFCIFIGNIAPAVTEAELQEFCEEVGLVQSCRIVRKTNTGMIAGKTDFGFCDFYDECTRQAAIDVLDGKELHGKVVKVQGETKAQHAIVSGFPEGWCLDHEKLVLRVKEMTKAIGQLEATPEVLEDGHKVRVQFVDQFLVRIMSVEFEGSTLEIAPCATPKAPKRHSEKVRFRHSEEGTVFIGNLPFDIVEEDVHSLCSEIGTVEDVRIPREQETNKSKGYAFCQFASTEAVADAIARLHGTKFQGKRLRVTRRGGIDRPGPHSRSRSRSPRGRRKNGDLQIHIDELEMPLRPAVEPAPADREVWVDPLPEEESEDWVSKFGEVAEVFRLGDRGYVKFKEHGSAKGCVEAGIAVWSESERILASTVKYRKVEAAAYPKSVIGVLLGNRGERISTLRDEVGLSVLSLRGESLGSKACSSSRLHFACRGFPEILAKVQPALEQLVAEVHNEMSEFLAKEPTMVNVKYSSDNLHSTANSQKKGGRKRKHDDSRGDRIEPDYPPGMWFPSPGMAPPSGSGTCVPLKPSRGTEAVRRPSRPSSRTTPEEAVDSSNISGLLNESMPEEAQGVFNAFKRRPMSSKRPTFGC